MKEIENREDVYQLVSSFYVKVRSNDLLGPIFNRMIPEQDWPKHIEKLTDFWETNLFGIHKYKGNPMLKHQNTDAKMKRSISQLHFGKWLELWFETINTLFVGEKADKAKDAARRMASGLFMGIWNNRPTATKDKN